MPVTDERIEEMTQAVRRLERDYETAKATMQRLAGCHEEYELAQAVVRAFETQNGCSEYRRVRIDLAFALLERQVGQPPVPGAGAHHEQTKPATEVELS